MLKEHRAEDIYEETIQTIVERLEKTGYEDIKADIPDYEAPNKIVSKDRDRFFIPDITAFKRGQKYYFEISRKNEDARKTARKWYVLDVLAKMKNGIFKVFIPYGSVKYTNTLMKRHKLNIPTARI